MVHGGWGVDGWVGVARHVLSMIDAEGVLAKGGVGLAVLEGLGLLLGFSALQLLLRCRWFEGIVVHVPYRQG